MKRPTLIALIAVIVVLLVTTGVLYSKYRTTSTDLAVTKTSETSVQSRYADAVSAIAEIQDSLNALPFGNTSPLAPRDLQMERAISGEHRHEALERIAIVNAGIERAKERINGLETQLRKSGVKVNGLQKMIANLKHDVTDREQTVAMLTSRVDSLQTQVTGLQTTVAANRDTLAMRDATLEERRRELGTVYYIVGSKKDL